MEKSLTKKELQEIENQLNCPSGKKGIDMAEMMNETNIGMTMETIEYLDIKNGNSVLELGPGNCSHLKNILEMAENIKYSGLEISETMVDEAKKRNKDLISDQITFTLYDGKSIPFPENSFDRVLTVNTIYFWAQPYKLLNEIGRILKPNGYCVLTFAQKDFMKELPFVGKKFKLYDSNDIRKLVKSSNMGLLEITDRREQVKNKAGKMINRIYAMAKLKK